MGVIYTFTQSLLIILCIVLCYYLQTSDFYFHISHTHLFQSLTPASLYLNVPYCKPNITQTELPFSPSSSTNLLLNPIFYFTMIFTVDSITDILHIPPLCPWSTIFGSHVDLTLFSFCVTPPSWHPINYQVLPKYLLNVNPSSLHLYFHHLRPPSCLSGLWSLTHSPNGHHCNLCKMLAHSSHSCASNTLRKSHFLIEDSNSLVPSSLTSSPSSMYIVLWLLRCIQHVSVHLEVMGWAPSFFQLKDHSVSLLWLLGPSCVCIFQFSNSTLNYTSVNFV